MNNIRDVLISMDNNPVRKTTDPYNLKDKVKEYINLANENITTEMDTESRYQALKGLYYVIDEENGSYVDEIKEASDPAVVKFLRRKNLNVEPREHGTGKALKNFIKYAKLAMCEATEVSNIGERHFFELEMDWKPQDGVWPAPAMLYALMDAIRWDGEYLWKQTKITTGKIMPKFWEKSNYFDKLNDEIRVAGEEAKQKAKEFSPIHFAGVAPDGRMVVGYSDEIQKLQEAQKSKVTIHKMTREEEMELIHEMVEEDRFWVAQPGKKVSRQGLYNSVGNYIDDITDYLRKANNSISFDDDIIVFRALRNILAEMIHDNGGYALNDIKIDSLLEDMGYPTEKKYGFRELLDYVQDRMYGGIDCWWVTKNKNGITNGEIVFTLLLHELATDVVLRFRKLQRTGKLTEEDKKPLWEPIVGVTFDQSEREAKEILAKFEKHEEPDSIVKITHPHFAKGKDRDHWKTVYHRAVRKQYISGQEVSCADFVYIMCGPENNLSQPPKNKIRWLCYTRSLFYIVKNYLDANWEVARYWFLDKKGHKLPTSFEKTNDPESKKNLSEIKEIFE